MGRWIHRKGLYMLVTFIKSGITENEDSGDDRDYLDLLGSLY